MSYVFLPVDFVASAEASSPDVSWPEKIDKTDNVIPIRPITKREPINKIGRLYIRMIGSAIRGEENWPRNKLAVKTPIFFPLTSAGLSSNTQKLRLAINNPRPRPAKKNSH